MHDDSDSSEVDEAQLARERAAMREAMGEPPTVPPTFPILSRPTEVQGDAGAAASGGGGSGADYGEDDDDDSDDSATIAQERAALQRAMGADGSELGFSPMASPAQPPFTRGSSQSSHAWSAPFARGPARDLGLPAPSSPAAGDANRQDALALQRALMANLKYQQVVHEEIAAIDRMLAIHRQAQVAHVRAAPQNAHEALHGGGTIPGAPHWLTLTPTPTLTLTLILTLILTLTRTRTPTLILALTLTLSRGTPVASRGRTGLAPA